MTFEELLAWAKGQQLTEEDLERQRRSFAYGNCHMSNPDITREDIDKAADSLGGKKCEP